MPGPLAAYRALLSEGSLRPDPVQAAAALKLESLAKALAGYDPGAGPAGWLSRFGLSFGQPKRLGWIPGDAVATEPRQGLYLYGEVGRGKSMLMDLFFANAPVAAKKRVHFHDFMRDVHAALHRLRADRSVGDPILVVAGEITRAAHLLCFDEFHVSDIADAMILGRLFEALLEQGVVVVVTSNRAPSELYRGGLQRERFLPFIDLLERRLDVLELASARDYRLGRKSGLAVYHHPAGAGAEAALNAIFERLSAGAPPTPDYLYVNGRSWLVARQAAGVAWFSFAELCESARGPADYLELATFYHAVLVSNVPAMGPAQRDAAKRFSTLIDALYEHKAVFACSAAALPEALYAAGDGAFEFRRTVSRLMEMQSDDYLSLAHLT